MYKYKKTVKKMTVLPGVVILLSYLLKDKRPDMPIEIIVGGIFSILTGIKDVLKHKFGINLL